MIIKIKDVMYKINLVDNKHDEINGEFYGKVNLYTKDIWLDKDYINVRETLIHELVHAFIFEYGFENVKWNEEMVCLFVSKYIDEINNKVKELEI